MSKEVSLVELIRRQLLGRRPYRWGQSKHHDSKNWPSMKEIRKSRKQERQNRKAQR